ncbi:hypothetical protein PHMEG_00038856 [Phytophthora megakarya]|uniref:RxLR effector PexRD54 WY domain-containing protein n=1 Tax=Phytophthora megakarya TaxID=4795 RepID=A0A225UGK9_9STRA|nr:hypothetical protein PHMEG_00038856 [Phytophthora megakarya]
MIEAFIKTFGDAGVTTMLHASKTRFNTDDIAKKLEADQLGMWLSSEKSADDLFTTLHLEKIEYDFSDNPLFKTWMSSYAFVFIKKHPEKKGHISDRLLIKMLEEAKKIPAMENAVTKTQTEKIQAFLASKTAPSDVFQLLGLNDAGDSVLITPLFQPWVEYVKNFNQKTSTNEKVGTMFSESEVIGLNSNDRSSKRW